MRIGIQNRAGRGIQVFALVWRADVVPRVAIGLDRFAFVDPNVAIGCSYWTRHREASSGLVVAGCGCLSFSSLDGLKALHGIYSRYCNLRLLSRSSIRHQTNCHL
jgi:hypothetical protein